MSRPWVRNRRRAWSARCLASAGWPAARAAVAAANSSSACLNAIPPCGGTWRSAASVSRAASPARPGGQQGGAAVDGQVGVGLAERVVAVPRLVEIGERPGQVAAAEGDQAAVVPGLGVFEFLAAGRVQFLGSREVGAGPPGEAEPEIDVGPVGQRPCFPHRVPGPAQVGQGPGQVLVCLGEPAHLGQDVGAPHEHAAGHAPARGHHRPVEHGQSLAAAAHPGEREPEGGLHVDLTLRRGRRAGQPHALPELGNGSREIPVIAQDDPDRVVSERGIVGTWPIGQKGSRGGQRVARPGHGERQKPRRIQLRVFRTRISRPHADDAKQFPTLFKYEMRQHVS